MRTQSCVLLLLNFLAVHLFICSPLYAAMSPASAKSKILALAEENDGWIHLAPGLRPAYAGVHGGTVPLTVMRSSDGVLTVRNGRTGNDFVQVLLRATVFAPEAFGSPDSGTILASAGIPAENAVPLGLNTPEGVRHIFVAMPKVTPAQKNKAPTILRLGSYQRLLAQQM